MLKFVKDSYPLVSVIHSCHELYHLQGNRRDSPSWLLTLIKEGSGSKDGRQQVLGCLFIPCH